MATLPLGNLEKLLKLQAEQVGANINKLKQRVATEVVSTVVDTTPVKTGRARHNWQTTIGSEASGTKPEPSNPDEGASNAKQNGHAVAVTAKEGQDIYVTNNLHYIESLNNGSSRQAPAGFVEAATVVAASLVKGAKII